MVEGGNIDHAGHSSDLEKNVFETIEFHNSVQLMLNWAAERDDTLVIVTADHETGGLHVVTNNGAGVLPTVNWTGGGNHTSANVPIYAWGKNAQLVGGVMDNTQMFWVCTSTPGTGAWGPVPEDGAILELDTFATLSWYPRIDAVSHNIYFGPSFDDVNDANDSALLINQSETACTVGKVGSAYPDALVPGTMYYWRVDEVNDIDPNNPYEGLVWSFFVPPVIAWNANPADGQKFVDPNVVLSWSKALGVKISDAHALYFGQDYNDVFDGNDNTFLGITDDPSYGLEMLEKDNIYYWRVDETIGSGRTKYVNKGDVWSFTVNEYLVLDDFEDYNDYSPDRVSDSWTGGADDPSNGAVVGYTDPNLAAGEHYAETKIVNSGGQSMPIFYDNNSMYSEASVTISSHRNWTEPNLPVLSIMFRGNKKNAPEPMYAAICNNPQTIAAVYHSDPNAVLLDKWTQWDIDLLSFTDMDIDLTNVDKLFIGFGDPADIKQDGGSGLVYFDNIRLYKPVEP